MSSSPHSRSASAAGVRASKKEKPRLI